MLKPVKKRFDIQVTVAKSTVTQTFELDKSIKNIVGILFTSDKDDLLYYRGTAKLEINKEEYFPENYESKLLMSGINVKPKDRYWPLGISPGNGIIKVVFTDNEDGRTPFVPYRVSLYADLEMEDQL